ncbi:MULTISPECIES: hypothetical protein [unclassified Pseudoalteromonas]|uniref:hypothetical protein n=1 Tax=unclassified Pseudoalteromonas TaxID=194690 RepID=UPI0015FF35A8|nr:MULTISPECIES: hypothetical protein [unclassified Pseudoalteromonas]MBB1349446.1 hypothetical protein [Pseudoalteromonas sp. SG45-3]MBB1356870.1 hypothetical protein [Pseudoalteromonas sp. SG45-6]MBQ4800037.1 hypothetical protein [Pseudoalteromonas sp. MMG006]
MKNLPVNLRDEIDALYIAAYEALEKKDLNTAKEQAEKAWELLPEPKFDWDVTLSFVSGICEMYKELGFYENSHKIVDELLNSDHLDDYDDGPIFLKGAIYFEQGELELAKMWFDKANTISKGRCFVSQPKKYKTFYSEYK